jgi:hypothetical protein
MPQISEREFERLPLRAHQLEGNAELAVSSPVTVGFASAGKSAEILSTHEESPG